jgi:dipeptidyl aminopeptidase/acylaminoacyl peptidase
VNDPTASPYGSWSSPISAEMIATAGVGLDQTWLEHGVCYWLEFRPTEGGRSVVVRGEVGVEPSDVTPEGFNVRTKVHEYGGGAHWVHEGTVFFANFDDQCLYRQEVGAEPVAITTDTGGRHRYADGRATPDGRLIACVRERHEGKSAADVVNELVVLAPDGSGSVQTIAGGRDFYAYPRPSPDGKQLAWLCWDHPNMPWDGCELWVADLGRDGSLTNNRKVAGGREESILQPEWSPNGVLHFVSERTGWWNLYRERDGAIDALHPADAEFGWPLWEFGASSFALLEDGRIACAYGKDGLQHVALLDPESGELLDFDLPYSAIDWPALRAEGSRLVFIAGGPAIPNQVVLLDFESRSVDVLRESRTIGFDLGYVSTPEAIEFPTEGGLTAHALFYPPANPAFIGEPGELPPLIVWTHGGPTGESTAIFDLRKQFFTSRGFAVVDVNYGGSSGHGRAYRKRLEGNWGIVDTADCVNAAKHLAKAGLVDGARMGIRGGSAGGYATLCALTFHDAFAAGASLFGVSDLESLAQDTHKFESRYLDGLVGAYPEAADVYRARSPIHFVDRISCPMILLQGSEDEVVPPDQAEMMVEAMQAKGLPYAYVLFEGEQHGFRKAENIVRSNEAELSFFAQIFGATLGDPIEPVEIRNLP